MIKNIFSRFWNYGQLHVKIESVICEECALYCSLLTAYSSPFRLADFFMRVK